MLNLTLNALSTAMIILMLDSESHVGTSAAVMPSLTTRASLSKTSRNMGVKRETISFFSNSTPSSSQLVDDWRHECLARLIGVDRERPLGSAALALGDLLEAEALEKAPHHVVFLSRKVMADNPLRS